MKKDDFFFQYQYDYELDARLKNRQERMWHYWKKVLIFSVPAFVIPLFFGKIDLSAIIYLIAGEEQLHFYCPYCRIYSDAHISRD